MRSLFFNMVGVLIVLGYGAVSLAADQKPARSAEQWRYVSYQGSGGIGCPKVAGFTGSTTGGTTFRPPP